MQITIKTTLRSMLLILMTFQLPAHPGWGIDVNDQGDVFYTDLHHIWKIPAEGVAQVWLNDVHSHDVVLDSQGVLFGTHEWFDSALSEFKRSYWKVEPDSKTKTKVSAYEALQELGIKWKDGVIFPDSNLHERSFQFLKYVNDDIRDVLHSGTMGSKDGPFESSQFGVFANWVLFDESLFLTSGSELRVIKNLQNVATVLGSKQGFPFKEDTFSQLLGVDVDKDGVIYVADYENRKFLKIINNKVTELIQSGWSWSAVGVKVKDDHVYLLESNRWPWNNSVRVRVIGPDKKIQVIGE